MQGAKRPVDKKRRMRAIKRTKTAMVKGMRDSGNSLTDHVRALYEHRLNEKLGILSLSRRSNSIVMWAHYAANHTGFILGFDQRHAFFQRQSDDYSDIGALQDVEYSAERLKVPMGEIRGQPRLFLRKNIDWIYEAEVRLIRCLEKAAERIDTKSLPVCLFDIPKDCITSLIFGLDCPEDQRIAITGKIRMDADLKHVHLHQARLDKHSFSIVSTPVC